MASSTDDYIEDKANSMKPGDLLSDFIGFLKSIAIKLLTVFIILLAGIFTLYGCKVSQANLFPTEKDCAPYEDTKPIIDPIPINIFNTTNEKGENLSQKIKFPYDLNSKDFLKDKLAGIKNHPKASSITNYMIAIILDLIHFDAHLIQVFFNMLNSGLPESVILWLGPLLLIFFAIFINIVNVFYLIWLWFSKMSWFFKRNVNTDIHSPQKWESVSLLEPFEFMFSCFITFIFVILFFVLFAFLFPMLAMFGFHSNLTTIIGAKGIIDDRQVTIFNIFKDVLKYKKTTIMYVVAAIIILTAVSYFPPMVAIVMLLVFILFIYGIIPNNMFSNVVPPNLSEVSSYNPAKKTCPVKIKERERRKGWLGFLWDLTRVFEPPSHQQQGGGVGGAKSSGGNGFQDFIKQMKKLGKKI